MVDSRSKLQSFIGWMRRNARLLGIVVFLVVLAVSAHSLGLRNQFNLSYLRETLEGHAIAGLLAFVMLFVLGNLIQLPGWLFLASAVLVLGPLKGGIVTYLSACISCAFTFLLMRWFGGAALQRLESPLAQRLLARLSARPVISIVVLRILFQTLPALNYTLALSGLSFRPYAMGTLLGLPLPIALYCIFFEQLARLLHVTH